MPGTSPSVHSRRPRGQSADARYKTEHDVKRGAAGSAKHRPYQATICFCSKNPTLGVILSHRAEDLSTPRRAQRCGCPARRQVSTPAAREAASADARYKTEHDVERGAAGSAKHRPYQATICFCSKNRALSVILGHRAEDLSTPPRAHRCGCPARRQVSTPVAREAPSADARYKTEHDVERGAAGSAKHRPYQATICFRSINRTRDVILGRRAEDLSTPPRVQRCGCPGRPHRSTPRCGRLSPFGAGHNPYSASINPAGVGFVHNRMR